MHDSLFLLAICLLFHRYLSFLNEKYYFSKIFSHLVVFVIYKNEVPTSQKFLIFTKGGLPATLAKIPFGEKNAVYGLMIVQLGRVFFFVE